MNLEKILMGLLLAGGLVACDDVDGEDGGAGAGGEGGADLGAAGEGGEGGTPETFDQVLVLDTSTEENMNGTPGADICGISVTCGGVAVASVAALLSPGDGNLCDAIAPPDCSADRTDPNAARDDGSTCEAASAPSDYVSIGMAGTLSVQFAQDLSGCTVEVVELEGNQAEAYEVYVCTAAEAGAGTCKADDAALGEATEGGTISVDVP